jgi:hypothetical protein
MFHSQQDWGQAIGFYQKALADWQKIGDETLTVSQMLWMAKIHLDLAGVFIDPQLKFNEALSHLKKSEHWIKKILSSREVLDSRSPLIKLNSVLIADAYQESAKVLLRRFELLLIQLARKGFQNSEFYRESAEIYDQLQALIHPSRL